MAVLKQNSLLIHNKTLRCDVTTVTFGYVVFRVKKNNCDLELSCESQQQDTVELKLQPGVRWLHPPPVRLSDWTHTSLAPLVSSGRSYHGLQNVIYLLHILSHIKVGQACSKRSLLRHTCQEPIPSAGGVLLLLDLSSSSLHRPAPFPHLHLFH